jgi:serine/threonine protein kinase
MINKEIFKNIYWIAKEEKNIKKYLINILNFQKINIYKVFFWHGGFKYFIGSKNSKKYFIKICTGKYNTIEKESIMYKKVNCNWFPKIEYFSNALYKIIITEYIKENKNSIPICEYRNIIKQAENILIDLYNIGIIHRDIRPSNIIIDKNCKLYLIDFAWSIDINDIKYDDKFIEKVLNFEYRFNEYTHDDAYSMYKTLKKILKKVEENDLNGIKILIGRFQIKSNN